MLVRKVSFVLLLCCTTIAYARKDNGFSIGVIGSEAYQRIKDWTNANINASVTKFTISDYTNVVIDTFDAMKSAYERVNRSDGIDAFIGDFQYNLSTIANELGIPYYITKDYPEKDSKWFIKMALQYNNFGDAISNFENVSYVNFIIIYESMLLELLDKFEFTLMTFTKLSAPTTTPTTTTTATPSSTLPAESSDSTTPIPLTTTTVAASGGNTSASNSQLSFNTSVLLKNASTAFVIAVSDATASNIGPILDQLMRGDMMYNQIIWLPGFFNQTTHNTILKYASTGARIKMFGNQTADLTSYKAYTVACALDAMQHFYASVKNFTFLNDTIFTNASNVTQTWRQGDSLRDILLKPTNLSPSATGDLNLMTALAGVTGLIRTRYFLLVLETKSNIIQPTTNITVVDTSIFPQAIQTGKPSIVATMATPDMTMSAFGADLVSYAFKLLNLPFRLEPFPERLIGVKKNGNWTGLMQYLINGKADLIGIPAIHSPSMNEVAAKSPVIFSGSIGMLAMKPQAQQSIARVLLAFSLFVWICTAIVVFFLIVVLFVTNKISPNQGKSVDELTWGNSSFVMFGSIVMAKLLVKPEMVSTRIFYLLVWFGTLILIACYAANLFAIQTAFIPPSFPFRSLQNLYSLPPENAYQPVFIRDGPVTQLVQDLMAISNSTTIVQLYNQALSRDVKNKTFLTSYDDVNATLNTDSKLVFIDGNKQIQKLSYTYCNLKQPATTMEDQVIYVILMRRDWPYIAAFSALLQNLTDNGYVQSLNVKYLTAGKCAALTNVPVTQSTEMDLWQMLGLFLIVGFGFGLSIVAVIVEAVYHCLRVVCIRRKRRPKFQFGTVYYGTVKAIKEDGIQVSLQNKRLGTVLVENPSQDKGLSPEAAGFPVGAPIKVRYIGNDPRTARMRFRIVKKK